MSESEQDPADNGPSNPILAKGRGHFVVVWGMLIFGVSSAILFAAIMSMVDDDLPFWPMLWLSLILFPVGGYFWGAIMWRFFEKQSEQIK